jgi:hypothetical protein
MATIARALTSSKLDSGTLPLGYYSKDHSLPINRAQQKTQNLIFQGLALLSGASLAKAGYVGYTQSVKNKTFYALLAVAITSLIAAWRYWPSSRNRNESEVALQLRQKAMQEIESSPNLKFSEFFRKYKGLLDRGILEPSDANFLLERDVVQLDYEPFMERHAGGDLHCKDEIIKGLSDSGMERLRMNCRVAFALDPSKKKDRVDEELLKNARNPNQAALLATDWDDFINNNGVGAVKDPQAVEALKILFLEKAYRGENSHRGSLFAFPEEDQKFIRATLSRFEFGLFLDGKVDFGAMVWNRDWVSIKACLEQADPTQQEAAKEKLRQGYLSGLSCEELNSEEWKDTRTMLGITADMIENAQGSIRSDADKLPYLGDNGFRSKYGSKPLTTNALLPPQLDKIRAELRQELPALDSVPSGIWEDLKILGIHDEILRARFEKIGLAHLWKEHVFFSEENQKILGIEVVKSKIIKELAGLSIFQILKSYSELFPKYLQPSDIFQDGKTFAERAEMEVALTGDLFKEVVPYDYYYRDEHNLMDFIPRLFEKGLLHPSSPALRSLLRKFLQTNTKEILEYTGGGLYPPTAISYWLKIRAIPQIFTPEVKGAYEAVLAAVAKARADLKTEKEEIQKRAYEPSETRKQLEQKLSAERKRLGEVQEEERKVRSESYTYSSKLHDKKRKLQEHRQKIYAQYSTLKGLPELQTKLLAQIAELEKAPSAADSAPLAQLSKRISEMRSSLQKQEQAYEQELEKLPEVQTKIAVITVARKALEGDVTDWGKNKEALKQRQQELKNHIKYECRVPEPLAKAREELLQCEKEQERLLQSLEVQSRKSEALEELKKKEQAIASQMESCRKNIPIFESELPELQAAYDQVEKENTARVAKEKDLPRQIKALEASVKKLEAETSKDPEREKFNGEITKAKQAAEEKHKAELQKQIDTLINKIAPEETVAAV